MQNTTREWPTGEAYARAIVAPNAVRDPALRDSVLASGPDGEPWMACGTFAATFRVHSSERDTALRCFVRRIDSLERRYTEIAELQRHVRNDALCATRYIAEGVFAHGTWWPAVAMTWVDGAPLHASVGAMLGESEALAAVAARFRQLIRSLEVLGIAHGDLQHGNIFLAGGELRLIDYDTMFVPALAGLAQVGFGHRNYQHPGRATARFDARLDRFSALVIYTALTALAADPSLWARFNDGGNLLFRAHDFTSDGRSQLFRALLANNAASGLAGVLLAACRGRVDDVPTLERAIALASGTMPAFAGVPQATSSKLRLRLPGDDAVETPAAAAPPPPRSVRAAPARERITAALLAAGPWQPRLFALMLTVLVGLGIGLAIAHRPGRTGGAAAVIRTKAPRLVALVTPAPRSTSTTAVAIRPTVMPTAVPARVTTPAPAAVPTRVPIPSRLPPAAPAAAGAPIDAKMLQGHWRISEANVQVGPMVWSGDAVLANRRTLVIDAHKALVDGRSATACERSTILHAEIAVDGTAHTVPFHETNCRGMTSSGEVRLISFSAQTQSFRGAFYEDGAKLGNFTASKQ